ncbi:hypothetical protein QE152_g29239 [Popillia japonica]|uniref:Peptidase A2 domain-containing protein n=1 Tax=Popillia japonica TaxID=7064 RepID=A0AAW1JHP6_POPJA
MVITIKKGSSIILQDKSKIVEGGEINGVFINFLIPILAAAAGPALANILNKVVDTIDDKINDKTISGLLDSGASRTIVGQPGCDILLGLGLPVKKRYSNCTVANGEQCEVTGIVSTPIRLRDQVRVIDVLMVPSVTHTLILGADFWKIHGIVPDLRRGEWTFSKNTPIATLEHITDQLTDEQQQQLKTLIDTSFPMCKEGELGCTNLVEHVIECTAAPIKQRYPSDFPIAQPLG